MGWQQHDRINQKQGQRYGFYIRNCMLITSTSRNNNIQFKGTLNEKANYVKEQLQKNTTNPKEIWKALMNLGMP